MGSGSIGIGIGSVCPVGGGGGGSIGGGGGGGGGDGGVDEWEPFEELGPPLSGCGATRRSASPWANWHLRPYGQTPLAEKLTQRTVLYRDASLTTTRFEGIRLDRGRVSRQALLSVRWRSLARFCRLRGRDSSIITSPTLRCEFMKRAVRGRAIFRCEAVLGKRPEGNSGEGCNPARLGPLILGGKTKWHHRPSGERAPRGFVTVSWTAEDTHSHRLHIPAPDCGGLWRRTVAPTRWRSRRTT